MKRKVLKPNVIGGGQAIPIGDNFYYMRGRKHAQGGIDIGANPKTGLEVEDGEVMHITNKDIKVYSSVPFLNGKSPAQKVMGGENPTKVFNEQERYKKRKGINDDGSKKKENGGKSIVNNTLTKQDLDKLNNREGIKVSRNDKPLKNIYPELILFPALRNIKEIYNAYKNIKDAKNKRFWFDKEKSRQDVINNNKKSMINDVIQIVNPLFAMGGKINNELSLTRRQYRTGGLYSLTVDGETKMRQFPTSIGEITKAEFGTVKKYVKKLYNIMTEPDANEPGIVLGGNNIATKMTYGEAKSKGLHKNWRGKTTGIAPNVSRTNVTKIVKGVQNTRKINQVARTSKTKNIINYTTKKAIQSKVKPVGKNSNVVYTTSSGEAVPRSWSNYANGTTLNPKATGTARRGNMENVSITRDNEGLIDNARFYWNVAKGKVRGVLNSAKSKKINNINSTNTLPVKYSRTRAAISKAKDNPYYTVFGIGTGIGITGGIIDALNSKNSNNSNNITIPYKPGVKPNNTVKINNTTNSDNKKDINTINNNDNIQNKSTKNITSTRKYNRKSTKKVQSKPAPLATIGIKPLHEFKAEPAKLPTAKLNIPDTAELKPVDVPYYKKESWLKRTMNKLGVEPNDIASLIPNIAGSIITHSINSRMLNNFKEPQAPIARQAVKLKTRINIEPQLDKMRESLAEYERQVDNNTASSNVALTRKNNFRLANIMNTNALYADKENKETALINQDRLNKQSVIDANVRDYNEYLARRNQYQNTIAEKRAENSVGLINNINAGIQNMLSNIDRRKSENRNIAAMAFAHPDLPIELFDKAGIVSKEVGDWYREGIGRNRRGMKKTI